MEETASVSELAGCSVAAGDLDLLDRRATLNVLEGALSSVPADLAGDTVVCTWLAGLRSVHCVVCVWCVVCCWGVL